MDMSNLSAQAMLACYDLFINNDTAADTGSQSNHNDICKAHAAALRCV